MKKFFNSLLSIVLTLLLVLPPGSAVRAKAGSKDPAKITGITYKLKQGVQILPSNISQLYDKSKGTITLNSSIRGFTPIVGQIYADLKKSSALKISFIQGSNKQIIVKTEIPQFNDVYESFNIPLQTVKPTEGNVKIYKTGVSLIAKPYTIKNESGEIHNFLLSNVVLMDEGNNHIKVSGNIELQLPAFTVQGSSTGFQIDFKTRENSSIDVNLEGTINTDHDFLIAGYTIPFNTGEANIGIYLHIKVNGQAAISFRVNENVIFNAGIAGKYNNSLPYDFGSHFTSEQNIGFYSSMQKSLTATTAVAFKCGLKALDINLAGFRTEFGENILASENNGNFDILVNAFFDSKAKVLGNDYAMKNREWKVYESHEIYTPAYSIKLNEFDAYANRISGTAYIYYSKPYNGNVSITVKHNGNPITINYFTAACNADGNFALNYAGLGPNNTVTAKIPESNPVVSINDIKAAVPFDKIEITSADVFNDKIEGRVSGNYTGPVTIVVDNLLDPTRTFNVTCTNGEFEYGTFLGLTGNDKVYAYLAYEGCTYTSPKVTAGLPFDIYLIVDKFGVKGTIQNMGGTRPYTGLVTILKSSFIPGNGPATVGTTTAAAYSSTGSSHFSFRGLTLPAQIPNLPWSVYAKVEDSLASAQGVFTINRIINIPGDPVIINFGLEMLSDNIFVR